MQEVEEELSVGKRKVASGGVRVTTSVSERPVEETVTLREEEVEVERRPADRKLKPEEAEAAFQDKTVEMLGTSEEAEVSKEARVVGEVSLGKRVEERKETVKDTVRRTEVEVEKIKPELAPRRTLSVSVPAAAAAEPGARAPGLLRSGEDDDRSCIPGQVGPRAPQDGRGPARSWALPRQRWAPPPSTTATAPARSSAGTRPPGASSRSTASGCTTSSGARARRWCCSTATW